MGRSCSVPTQGSLAGMSTLIEVTIISSKTGGTPGETDAYDRETTIRRNQHAIEAAVTEHVPRGQISTVKIRVKKPDRSLLGSGVKASTLQFRIAIGAASDMDRDNVIRSCRAAVPELVTANVPADHLCSLVIGLKGVAAA